MKDIAEWLASIGLGEYAQRFAENAIDLSVIRDLTEQDLKELGVLLGHRRKMLRAIAEFRRRPRASWKRAPSRRGTMPSGVNLQSCFAIWSARRHFRPALIRRTCAVMAPYHRCIAEVIGRNEGVIARYMGDGVLAYFGYPQAHEDDAEQATRAGLALVDAVAKLRTDRGAPSYRFALASLPGWSWWRFDRRRWLRSRRSLARRRTWLRACRRSPIPVPC